MNTIHTLARQASPHNRNAPSPLCPSDHDAGTFQKILCEKRIVVMTTKTIYESFIRKYSALSGIDDNFLKRSHKVRTAPVWPSMIGFEM